MRRLAKLAIGLAGIAAMALAGLVAAYIWLPVNIPVIGMLFDERLGFAQEAKLRERLTLPPGYAISIYATGVSTARVIQITGRGHLLVSARDAGEVRLVRADGDGDGRADGVETIASGLDSPHGLWLEDDVLYVAEEGRIVRFAFDETAGTLSEPRTVLDGLPHGHGHYSRTVKRGPDGWYYVTVGSSCNACVEEHPWRAAMLRFRPGEEPELYATGLRNVVDFDWQPGTGILWGADVARDWLGDDFPPDELNRIVEGGFYGWPFFNGDNVADPDHAPPPGTPEPISPEHGFAAHTTPLGIAFLQHQPEGFLSDAALVALHGSWNSTEKVGYAVVRLTWEADGTIRQSPFITGFEIDGEVIGRPVDVAEAPDGTLYISDDFGDAIYRVTYEPQ